MSSPKSTPRVPALHARIRRRRAQIGLTGTELGQRAGISTSYVSVIENGSRVPEESVAAALARALGDDEALYRAWARAARLGVHDLDLLNQLEAIARTPALVSLVENGEPLPGPGPATPRESKPGGDLAARLRAVASRVEPVPGVLSIPVLEAGADPVEGGLAGERLLLDARLLRDVDASSLFACEVPAGGVKHLRGVAAAGDRLVFRRGGPVSPDRVSAIRAASGITLARALVNDRTVVLLPGDGEADFETVRLGEGQRVEDVVAGTQVLLIRA